MKGLKSSDIVVIVLICALVYLVFTSYFPYDRVRQMTEAQGYV